jgi:hypothetical protein
MASILLRPRRDSQESLRSFRSVNIGILGLTWQTKTRRLAKDAFRSRRDSQESRRKSQAIRSGSPQETSAQRLARDASSRDQEGLQQGVRSGPEQNNSAPSANIRARLSGHPWQTLPQGRPGWQAAGATAEPSRFTSSVPSNLDRTASADPKVSGRHVHNASVIVIDGTCRFLLFSIERTSNVF